MTRLDAPAVESLVAELKSTPPGQFQKVAGHLRNVTRNHGLNGGAAEREAMLDDTPGLAVLWLCHPSGYHREAALRRIESVDAAPLLLALVLWRMNDWVPHVRRAADLCLQRVIGEFDAAALKPLVPVLALRVPSWGRHRQGAEGLLSAPTGLPGILRDEPGRSAVLDYVLETAAGPVAKVLRRALTTGGFDADLPRIARDARNGGARQIAVETLLSGRAVWSRGYGRQWVDKTQGESRRVPLLEVRRLDLTVDRDAILTSALADPFARVRLSAVWAMTRDGVPPAVGPLLPALRSDKSRSVREAVDFLNRKFAETS